MKEKYDKLNEIPIQTIVMLSKYTPITVFIICYLKNLFTERPVGYDEYGTCPNNTKWNGKSATEPMRLKCTCSIEKEA